MTPMLSKLRCPFITTSSSSSTLLRSGLLRRFFSSSTDDDKTPISVETSVPFIAHRCEPPSRIVESTPKELMSFFKDMVLMRRMEIAADSLYKSKLIRGFCHLYDGQEAVCVGMEAAITQSCTYAFSETAYFLAVDHDGMGTAEWRAAKSPSYYKRGDYVPGLKVDGMDALAVKQAVKFSKEHALKNGPIERDPIERVRKLILAHEIATADELKVLEKGARKQVDDAVAQAKESPMPDLSELFSHVYVKGLGAEAFGPDRKEMRATLL